MVTRIEREKERGVFAPWLKSWGWAVFFCCCCFALHMAMNKNRSASIREYEWRLSELEKEKCCALADNEELSLRIQSQSDPAWIEMVLMREIGVVPEGWLKVHFTR